MYRRLSPHFCSSSHFVPQVVLWLLAAAASAAPHGYGSPVRPFVQGCGQGRVLHIDGSCVYPTVHQFVYLYAAPEQPPSYGPPPKIPRPEVQHNVVLIKAPEAPKSPEPIVVPPAQQKHVVYVLNKQSQQDQRVIQAPAPPPTSPEVYFVDYDDDGSPDPSGGGGVGTPALLGGGGVGTPASPSGFDFRAALRSVVGNPYQGAGGAAGGVIRNPGGVAGQAGAYTAPRNPIYTPPSLYPLP